MTKLVYCSLISLVLLLGVAREAKAYHHSKVAWLAQETIDVLSELQGYVNYEEYGTYILPMKKQAAKAKSVGEAYGDASQYARPYFLNFLYTMDDAEYFLDSLTERPAVAHLGWDLIELRERLRRLLE